jgi:transcription elongation factor GreB
MSKAFTKETDQEEDDDQEQGPLIPRGVKNYITPSGLEKIKAELHQLTKVERPQVCSVVSWAAENGDRSENADYQYGKRRLRQIDSRVRFLSKRLDNVELVDPLTIPDKSKVFFGATVVVREEDGSERTFRIVGIDESNAELGKISWISPLANALFKSEEGDLVTFKSPKGPREMEIVEIRYEPIE